MLHKRLNGYKTKKSIAAKPNANKKSHGTCPHGAQFGWAARVWATKITPILSAQVTCMSSDVPKRLLLRPRGLGPHQKATATFALQ
jgi:hypothetical protein